ncbi:MAG: ATP-binding protein [Actinomycetota bacterium]|nr:ATP-binding protein [Actinomycetota bacterium]
MIEPIVVPTRAVLRYETADTYLHELQTLAVANPDRPIELDLHGVDGAETTAGILVANGLVGSLRDANLVFRVPENDATQAWFARSGISFAVANRPPSKTTVLAPKEFVSDLDGWRRSWSPASPLSFKNRIGYDQEALFGADAVGETDDQPNVVARSHAAFVNPHLATSVGVESDVARVVRPWLSRLLPRRHADGRSPRVAQFAGDVGAVLDELLQNVREHAATAQSESPDATTKSLVQVAVTRTDGFKTYLAVQDTGPGIPTTARPKITDQDRDADRVSDEELVTKLLDGAFFPWHRGRGIGLPRVRRICADYGGWIRFATRKVRVQIDDDLRSGTSPFDLLGTVVIAMIPVPDVNDATAAA